MGFKPLGLTPLIGVFDMTCSLAFYRDLLGFELVAAAPEVDTREGRFSHWMWLRRGDADIMLNTQFDSNERPDSEEPARRIAHGDMSLYIGCADVDAAFEELRQNGLQAEPPEEAPYGLRLFSVSDPDGYRVIFQEVR